MRMHRSKRKEARCSSMLEILRAASRVVRLLVATIIRTTTSSTCKVVVPKGVQASLDREAATSSTTNSTWAAAPKEDPKVLEVATSSTISSMSVVALKMLLTRLPASLQEIVVATNSTINSTWVVAPKEDPKVQAVTTSSTISSMSAVAPKMLRASLQEVVVATKNIISNTRVAVPKEDQKVRVVATSSTISNMLVVVRKMLRASLCS